MKTKISLQEIFDAGWQAFVLEDRKPGWEYFPSKKTGLCVNQSSVDPERCCPVGLVLVRRGLISLCDPNDSLRSVVYRLGRRCTSALLEIKSQDSESFQRDVHDKMVLRHSGKWKVRYNTQEKREAVYRTVAKKFGLKIPGE